METARESVDTAGGAAGGLLPLRLTGQAVGPAGELGEPAAVGHGFVTGDPDDGGLPYLWAADQLPNNAMPATDWPTERRTGLPVSVFPLRPTHPSGVPEPPPLGQG